MQTKTLFSHHYLENRLPNLPEWREDPRPAFDAARALWRTAREQGQHWNEAQTEEAFIKPMLDLLGWSTIVQASARRHGRVTRPDYALFPDATTRDAAMPLQGDDDAFYALVQAIGEAKYWSRPLSQSDNAGRESWDAQRNPSHQMVSYLAGTRVAWGILTNGVVWRLYSREVSSTASEFYEVDLGGIFDHLPADGEPSAAHLDDFRRWQLFFRQAAFVPDARGRSFVQRIHEGSATYARRISDKLKELVYEEVMPEVAGGFVAYRYHQVGAREESAADLRLIYRASLSLLYKLLFILYAEARGLLPVSNPGYREGSLTEMAKWAARRIDQGLPISDATHATARYDALLALFHRIDRGDPSLGIPRYDGGLFNPASEENVFLEQHKLSDRAVARAVDILVRDAGEPVDYAYIGVRNLGAIYEGLLENRLVVEDAGAGRVALVNDKGERKATGSYYTPDYIVEYIVRRTLDPILKERDAAFRAAMDRCADLRQRLARQADPTANRLLRERLTAAERDAREAFLGVKALDPAMGSGHFLVNAVDYLTDEIIRRIQVYHDETGVDWAWNPIQAMIERLRGEIEGEMARQGIAVDPARLDDTALLTRLVMKRCIYGVDLNRMAVELAKLSLWLHTFTVGAPLSFLDHHLRWGNSLIGADVRTVEREIQGADQGGAVQLGLFAGPFAGLLDLTGLMVEVVERADATLADVRRSAEIFEQFRRALTPYKRALDLWVSRYFGNEAAYEFLTLYGSDVIPAIKGEVEAAAEYEAAIERARALYEEKRFFHWDLEFPEVFVDLEKRDWAENPGFDAVVGNPPYDELSEEDLGREIDEKPYLEASPRFSPAMGYRVNIYRLFITQALKLTAQNGWQSFIVPISLLADRFTLDLRKFLLENVSIQRIEQLPQKDNPLDRVFPSAKLSTCLYAIQKSSPKDTNVFVRTHPGREILEKSPSYSTPQSRFFKFDSENLSIPGMGQKEWDVVVRISTDERFHPLGDVARAVPGELMINRQFQPYLCDQFDGEEIIRGAHIGMYEIVKPKQGEPLYLKRAKYLSEHQGSEKAFHHQRRRVVYQRYAAIDNYRRLIAAILPKGYFCSHTVGYLTDVKNYALGFFVSLLNSEILDWRFDLTSTNNNINGYEVEALVIPRISFTTPSDERERLTALGITEATEWIERTEGAFSDSSLGRWLDARLSADPEQSDVVHDLLAHLAEEMIAMHKERQRVEQALDPFKYLDKGAPFLPFPQAFAEEIMYGQRATAPVDLGAVHHDIDGLRLVPVGDGPALSGVEGWALQVQLKKRDPASDWRAWQYEAGEGGAIAREWATAYRFHVDEKKARYYRHALPARDAFAEAGSFPGGYTRSTAKKLQLTEVPAFDPALDLRPLDDLGERLSGLQARIAATDRLIDLIVYRLYGLTAAEVAIVEGRAAADAGATA